MKKRILIVTIVNIVLGVGLGQAQDLVYNRCQGQYLQLESNTTKEIKEKWDVMATFSTINGGQQGVASDGEYIYTCSWMANPIGGCWFQKYDLNGFFVEAFNIEGVDQIRDLTYDGQFFYGGKNTNYLYKFDLANKQVVDSVSTTCNVIQHCSYDPDNDGFWVGYWNTLKLINRSGQTIRTAPNPQGAHGSGYYKDEDNIAHLYLFCQPNQNSVVYDYNITNNVMGSAPIYDFANVPGYSNANNGGIAGGAFIGPYNGEVAFFGNVQQSPNLVGILELKSNSPSGDMVRVSLTAGNIWNDNTGYQMLLDADANTFGTVIPATGALTSSGDAAPEVYAQFEYKIPTNADGVLTTQNIVLNATVSIQIPAGTYDWCITNPTPEDRIWIASAEGNVGGRQNDYLFEANKEYRFIVRREGNGDAVDVVITDVLTTNCQISATVDPGNSGVISGAGVYEYGSECTLTASPNNGYSFVNWTKNGIVVSDNSSYTFTVIEDAAYVAHFQPSFAGYTISAEANPANGGSVTGAGTYAYGETVTLTASPNTGYSFVNWTKEGLPVSANASFSFTVSENANYVANFNQTVSGYTISANSNPSNGGAVTGTGTYAQGMTITLTATPNTGYGFASWTENGVIQCLTEQYEFVVDRDRTLVANFEALPVFTITAMAGSGGSITPQGDIQVPQGGEVTFNIVADFGSVVKQVLIDGMDVGAVATYTFTNVNRDHTIYVVFSGWDVDEHLDNAILMYPNPSNGEVTLEGDGINIVRIYDMTGCKLYDVEVKSNPIVIGTDKFHVGTYLVELNFDNGTKTYKKLVVSF